MQIIFYCKEGGKQYVQYISSKICRIKEATFLALLLVDWVKPQCKNEKTEMFDFIARDQNEIK